MMMMPKENHKQKSKANKSKNQTLRFAEFAGQMGYVEIERAKKRRCVSSRFSVVFLICR